MTPSGKLGEVYLVGAGPGDPGLITVRGVECLRRADSVVYDALVNEELLKYAPDAARFFVGKRHGSHPVPQEEVNRMLVEQARAGAVVVRLKGGDPFVFGRGGEEALALVQHGIPFTVVPGVTAGIAVPAYAGIPVTHRSLAASCILLTGHSGQDIESLLSDPRRLLRESTLVFYMGVHNLASIVRELLRCGFPPEMPAAAIEQGTHRAQRTITTTLAEIGALCAAEQVEPPAIIIVGKTVALREQLDWFTPVPESL
jgi:uroporphyrin-III C-methyltransferase